MIWVKFDSLNDFEEWHSIIKSELGLPKVSVDIDGNPVLEATRTTDYVTPQIVSNEDVRALIDEKYAKDLKRSQSPFASNYDQTNA